MAPCGVRHHPGGVSSGPKRQVGGGVGVWRVGGEVGGWSQVGHERRLLAGGVRDLVRETAALLTGRLVAELLSEVKERTENTKKSVKLKICQIYSENLSNLQ